MCLIKKVLFFALALACCLLPPCISHAANISLTPEQTETLADNLEILAYNNNKLATLLAEQRQELIRLKSVSQNQSRMLTQSQTDLHDCKLNLTIAQKSLETAQSELDSALLSYKKQERREKRLRRQRNFWAVVSASLAVGLAISFAR